MSSELSFSSCEMVYDVVWTWRMRWRYEVWQLELCCSLCFSGAAHLSGFLCLLSCNFLNQTLERYLLSNLISLEIGSYDRVWPNMSARWWFFTPCWQIHAHIEATILVWPLLPSAGPPLQLRFYEDKTLREDLIDSLVHTRIRPWRGPHWLPGPVSPLPLSVYS